MALPERGRLYDLRHTFPSLLLAGGAPITYVSAQLGHANPAMTLRYYARSISGHGRRWVDLLDLDRPTAIPESEMEPKGMPDLPAIHGRLTDEIAA